MFGKGRKHGLREAGWGQTLFAGTIGLLYFFPVLWIILTAFGGYGAWRLYRIPR